MQPTEAMSAPLETFLRSVLAGVLRDLPGAVGTAVSVAHPAPDRGGGRLRVLAATGIGRVIVPITTGHLWGPSLWGAANEEPIVSADLWHDPRWPHLTLDVMLAETPAEARAEVARLRGAVAVPSIWQDDGVVMLSAYLDRPADDGTLATLSRHEPLVTSAVTVADIASQSEERHQNVLDAMASRAAIEQAKGAVMALRRCDAEEAWTVLRRASQEFNVKLRELAVALVEHVGQAPAEQPDDTAQVIIAGSTAQAAAVQVWRALAAPVLTEAAIDLSEQAVTGPAN